MPIKWREQDERIGEALDTAIEIANVRRTCDGIWNALPLKEKLHFIKKAGYEVEIPPSLRKIYGNN